MKADEAAADTGTTQTGAPEATAEGATPEERRALFRVVRGEPTDAELAALTVVIAASASAGGDRAPVARDRWSDPAARMRGTLTPGPGAWRASTWPR